MCRGMLSLLWKHRECPAIGSPRWWKVWAKRVITAPALFASLIRLEKLKLNGAQIELPVYISPSTWNGKAANLTIGKGSFVGRVEVHLHDRVSIGRNVIINDGVRLLTASHMIDDADFKLLTGAIEIGDYAWIAIGAMILPGVSVGTGAVVGAGAVVTKNVPDYAVAVGNPARILNTSRSTKLRYKPLSFLATFEAWLGREAIRATGLEEYETVS